MTTPFSILSIIVMLGAASAVLASLLVKGKNKAVAENWQKVAESATARAAEATARADALQIRVDHLEEQVRVLIDTVTAKDSIDHLSNNVHKQFEALTALVVEAMTTAGVQRAPASSRGERKL